jgi:hypothetical protein
VVAQQCGGAAADILVDLDALTSLREDLSIVRDALDGLRVGATASGPEVFGGVPVAHAVECFETGWRDASERLVDQLDQCIVGLQDAVAAYQQTEAGLRAATDRPGE